MGKTIILTDKNFDEAVIKSKIPFLVDFWAPWCGPCKMMGPVLEELSNVFDGKIAIGKLDVDNPDHQQLAIQYQIQSIPNMKLFVGGKPVRDFIGFRDQASFAKELAALLEQGLS